MGQLETQTTHTVTISWDSDDTLEKEELIRGLNDALPDSAIITGLSVADIPMEEPHEITQAAKRALTITYIENPVLAHYRRP